MNALQSFSMCAHRQKLTYLGNGRFFEAVFAFCSKQTHCLEFFCTNNAQAPSLFSNVTLTSRRSYVETVSGKSALLQSNGTFLPETVSTYDRLLVSVTLEKREGACALFVQKTPDMFTNLPSARKTLQTHCSFIYIYLFIYLCCCCCCCCCVILISVKWLTIKSSTKN